MVIPHTDRMDYVCAMTNNLAYAETVEKLMKLEVPERARYILRVRALARDVAAAYFASRDLAYPGFT